jgi:hypothetical protein
MRLLGLSVRQTEYMLPRKKYLRVLCLAMAGTFTAGTLISAPAAAVTGYTPQVSVNEISVTPITKRKATSLSTASVSELSTGTLITTLLPAQTVSPFTLVGLTWVGPVANGTEFKVRVRESGVWSVWFELEYSEYQGVGDDGTESADARIGSDPLLTGLADGVEVLMENSTGFVPEQMKVTLINSQVTNQDQSIGQQSIRMATSDTTMQSQAVSAFAGASVSPQGALVARPRIVSRAEWGANESWRDPVPRVGTKILAGIVHHTASTNNYTADQAPAQMRNLYAYFTRSLNYADMGYNFLVDKYGTIYEGRSGCAVGAVGCDSASVVAQGAHTAGLNVNTFGVSAIGNYDVLAPENPAAMVESIASLMAWKLAPYGLDPNSTAYIPSTDTSGSSKYSAGQTAITQVISAHRDVGRTACPGRYLYPYMSEIRARATTLLAPVIQGVSVSPTLISSETSEPVNVSATIPANSTWSVNVTNADSGAPIQAVNGTQTVSGPVAFAWDRKDGAGTLVPVGRYAVTINATVGGITLPSATNVVSIASSPQAVTQVGFLRTSSTKTKVSWVADATNPAPVTANQYRISTNGGSTWSAWRATSSQSFSAKWRLKRTYLVEIKSINALGESTIVRSKYKVKKFAPPKPAAVTKINFKRLSKNRVTVSWTPAPTEFASSGYYYRVAKNGGKYGKWTKSSGMKTAVTLSKWKKNQTYKIQVKTRNITGYSPTVTTSYTAR